MGTLGCMQRNACEVGSQGRGLMADGGGPAIRIAGLERALKAADPGAFLVPPRILRRVIRQDRRPVWVGLRVPHRDCYAIAGEAAIRIVERETLGLGPIEPAPRGGLIIAR